MKGIILAGGSGTRLYPITKAISKQILPVGGKPMIYYPLSTLMLSGISEFAIISTPRDLPFFQSLLGDGSQLGLKIEYIVQKNPEGIAQSFILAEDFIGDDCVALILGDNIFHAHDMKELLSDIDDPLDGGVVFGYEVDDPRRYGVVAFDDSHSVIDIIEKPQHPPSHYAVTGLYFYDNNVVDIANRLKPSNRGELEITDVNRAYLQERALKVKLLGRGFAWLDTGTHTDLQNASSYIDTIQKRQGIQIGCIEEVAYEMGFIDLSTLRAHGEEQANSDYGRYLIKLAEQQLHLSSV
ncbi:MAG: glucose-1-phosphate thymidylyltransferase RfbA [Simkaniaceae bacterium]|nr:glucose-1-phosphate thymidylyltransferase RfbA [Simkaniaceae bacterium]